MQFYRSTTHSIGNIDELIDPCERREDRSAIYDQYDMLCSTDESITTIGRHRPLSLRSSSKGWIRCRRHRRCLLAGLCHPTFHIPPAMK